MPAKQSTKTKKTSPKTVSAKDILTEESVAAISMAVHLYLNELHDVESGVVTIKRISKIYSPWSSKLYNMRNL